MDIIEIKDPPLAHTLFSTTRFSWLWVVVRFYLGYSWISAGLEKLADPTWVGAKSGVAIGGFIQAALQKTQGLHPDVSGSYAWFLQHAVLTHPTLWSYIITWGEIGVGLALLIGAFTGIAAFFGLFMNMNYLLAGTVSVNPILGVLAVFVILGWKVAGYVGADRYLLPLLGTPWSPGVVFKK